MATKSNQLTSPDCSPSSSTSGGWDVFLSFRGKDTRNNFTAYLYNALDQAGIRTFRDDPQLGKGESISLELIKAIQNSNISIVVLSENYASSTWCLDELLVILDCRRTKSQIVLPVFYHINPAAVRYDIGSFAEALQKHAIRFSAEMVEKWKAALTEIANLSGYHLKKDADVEEPDVIQAIVKDIAPKVYTNQLFLDEHLVGITSPIQEIYEKLSIMSNNIRVIGICGMGGIGKTTIAKAFYNLYSHQFELSCFLENVKETTQGSRGLLSFIEQLLFELLKIEEIKLVSVDKGIRILREKLCNKKLLIVLDDMDQPHHLKVLVRNCNLMLHKESRIIITTRDSRLLNELEVDIYMLQNLKQKESLELFCYYAFRRTIPLEDFMEISKRIVNYVGGLPIALQVLGSFLFKRNLLEWRSSFEKVQQIPNNDIQKLLKLSYDELGDEKLKAIFLDIAFFFIGKDKDEAVDIFNSCGFFADIGIQILLERCLLTIDKHNRFCMHNLIRDMGKEIAREESELGKSSRLYCQGNACDVLKNRKGADKIEGLILDLTMSKKKPFNAQTFERLPNLRLLQITNGHDLEGSFENSLTELRWIHWHYFPGKHLPSSFHPENLVSLDMQFSTFNRLWEGTMHLASLKTVDVSYSMYLTTTPDFEKVKMVKKLLLRHCSSLSNIHPSIGQLNNMVHLDLSYCSELKELPEELDDMVSLKTLNASSSGIKQLSDSFGQLINLVELQLSGCKDLQNLPDSICNLSSLEILDLDRCSIIDRLPEQLGNMQGLRKLSACDTSIRILPYSIGQLSRLQTLLLDGCKKLENLPNSICNVTSLRQLHLSHCNNIIEFPSSFKTLKNLESLRMWRCNIRLFLPTISCLSSLKMLSLTDEGGSFSSTESVNSGGKSLLELYNLERVEMNNCTSLGSSFLELPANIEQLIVCNCTSMEHLPDLSSFKQLKMLRIRKCNSLQSFPVFPPSLFSIEVSNCTNLQILPDLSALKELYRLDLTNCSSLQFNMEESFFQVTARSGFEAFLPPNVKIPEWFTYKNNGCNACFRMPSVLGNNFLGMALCVCYVKTTRISIMMAVVTNETDGTKREFHIILPNYEVAQEQTLIKFITREHISVKSGDRIMVSFVRGFKYMFLGLKVESCGVHLIYR